MIIKIIEKYGALFASWKVIEYDQDGPNLRLKAEFEFTDGSKFFVRQVVLKEFTFKYAYHWQDKEGQLRCRWDNAPHWPDMATHPHRKHIPIVNTSCLAIKFLLTLREVETWNLYLMRLRNFFQVFSIQTPINEKSEDFFAPISTST